MLVISSICHRTSNHLKSLVAGEKPTSCRELEKQTMTNDERKRRKLYTWSPLALQGSRVDLWPAVSYPRTTWWSSIWSHRPWRAAWETPVHLDSLLPRQQILSSHSLATQFYGGSHIKQPLGQCQSTTFTVQVSSECVMEMCPVRGHQIPTFSITVLVQKYQGWWSNETLNPNWMREVPAVHYPLVSHLSLYWVTIG